MKKFNVVGVVESIENNLFRVRYSEKSVTPPLEILNLGIGKLHLKSDVLVGDKVFITHVEYGVLIPIADEEVVVDYNRNESVLTFRKNAVFEDSLQITKDLEVKGKLIVGGMDIKKAMETHTHGAGSLVGQSKVSGVTGVMQ